jgi:hypothetical protein
MTLAVAPGGEHTSNALASALDALRHAGWQCQRLMPASEATLRRELGASLVLHLVADATAVGTSYVTLRLADSSGGVRSLNVQALATLLRQTAPGLRLLVLQPATSDAGARSAHALAVRALQRAGICALVSMNEPGAGALVAFYRALTAGSCVDGSSAAANATALGQVVVVHAGGGLRPASTPGPGAASVQQTVPAAAPAAPAATASATAAEEAAAQTLRSKREAGHFDVFLCHNSADKPAVKRLGEGLKARSLLPWLDEWELPPGQAWQELLERQIQRIASAAVCIGPAGLSPWHQQEMRGFISEFVDRRLPVIPVLLPGAPAQPELPLFLRQFTWVDFRRVEPDPLDHLVWGITGRRPQGR